MAKRSRTYAVERRFVFRIGLVSRKLMRFGQTLGEIGHASLNSSTALAKSSCSGSVYEKNLLRRSATFCGSVRSTRNSSPPLP